MRSVLDDRRSCHSARWLAQQPRKSRPAIVARFRRAASTRGDFTIRPSSCRLLTRQSLTTGSIFLDRQIRIMGGAPVQCLPARLELGRLGIGAGHKKVVIEVTQRELPHFAGSCHFSSTSRCTTACGFPALIPVFVLPWIELRIQHKRTQLRLY